MAAKSQVYPIRSAGVIEQNGFRACRRASPRVPGFIRELWLSTEGPSAGRTRDRIGNPMTPPDRTVYITG